MIRELGKAARFVGALRGFLGAPWEPARAVAEVEARIHGRQQSFLTLIERAIFTRPASPYRKLMQAAGVEYGDIAALVRTEGVEGAPGVLFDAGVRVTLDEFKGRQAIRRSGLELPVRAEEFDNPFLRSHYEGRTGGSRGAGTRLIIDLDLLRYEAAHVFLGLLSLDALERPAAVWRPVPPGVTGMKEVLYRARLGRLPEVWFTQVRYRCRLDDLKYAGLTGCTLLGSRLWGRPLPRPRHLPLQQADQVVAWLADKRSSGVAALLDANVSTVVRVCLAARESGADIAGALFRTGGEPLTPTRAEIVAGVGCRVACSYGIAEIGRLGMACGRPDAVDDVHVLVDKVALLHRRKEIAGAGHSVDAIHVTTLHPSTPKLMLNVEIGDYAVPSRRSCGCALGEVGLVDHLHTIRSYEKLTSEGMQFLGSDLLELLEQTLPSRFGGGPTDYQLVEEEVGGLARVRLLVSPHLGELDESALIETALASLRTGGQGRGMMSRWWQEGGVLRVERREPYLTAALKVLPLHVRR
ncbi:MAG: hypothetical protein P1P84_05080 [Deferrisomatales bacterium]|nr:hypothetical protein [Deferrisomatales bacterium]